MKMTKARETFEPLTGLVDRKVQLAKDVLTSLENGCALSAVLNSTRGLASLEGDIEMTTLVDLMIYGVGRVPASSVPYPGAVTQGAFERFEDIFSVPNHLGELGLNKRKSRSEQNRDHVLTASVYLLEKSQAPERPDRFIGSQSVDLYVGGTMLHHECEAAVNRARGVVYNYVFNAWRRSAEEKDAISLLGADYRIVLDSLAALDTEVGGELRAALSNLSSTEPGNWSLAALGCRNVLLKLGRLLWQGDQKSYYSALLERTLDLTGESEKNKLSAYIDYCYMRAGQEAKPLLKEALDLIVPIYEKGSKGKAGSIIRHEEAQKLVVDTFRLVDLLLQSTQLTPSKGQQ